MLNNVERERYEGDGLIQRPPSGVFLKTTHQGLISIEGQFGASRWFSGNLGLALGINMHRMSLGGPFTSHPPRSVMRHWPRKSTIGLEMVWSTLSRG